MVSLRVTTGSTSVVLLRFGRPALLGFLVPLFGVAVAVEEDLLALLDDAGEQVLDGLVEVFAALDVGFELGGDEVERLGDDRVEHRVGAGDVGTGADGAELKLVAGEGERAGAVAVAGFLGKRRQDRHAGHERAALLAGLGAGLFRADRRCPGAGRRGRRR